MGNGFHGAPHGNVRSQKGGDCFDKLSKSQRAGQLVTTDNARQQRVQGGLHQGVADTQQGEGDQHAGIASVEDRKQE